MIAAFRTALAPALLSSSPPLRLHSSSSLSRLLPLPLSTLLTHPLFFQLSSSSFNPPAAAAAPEPPSPAPTSSVADSLGCLPSSHSPFMEKQFDDFRLQLEESGGVRERIRSVAAEIESATRFMNSSLLLVHKSGPAPEVLEKAEGQIEVIKGLFGRLAAILGECPGQYYRYHGDWRSETQTVVSLLAFMHWMETGALLLHAEAEKKLGLNASEIALDIEDYLIGLCFMSNEFPRYVVNRVTAGDYDCPRKVLNFLTDLHSSFRMLNLRNDFLRKKFDGMKYDLRKVEEVFYDVKIRGLASGNSTQDQMAGP